MARSLGMVPASPGDQPHEAATDPPGEHHRGEPEARSETDLEARDPGALALAALAWRAPTATCQDVTHLVGVPVVEVIATAANAPETAIRPGDASAVARR